MSQIDNRRRVSSTNDHRANSCGLAVPFCESYARRCPVYDAENMTEERLETLLAYALILVFLRAGLVIIVAVSSEHFSPIGSSSTPMITFRCRPLSQRDVIHIAASRWKTL